MTVAVAVAGTEEQPVEQHCALPGIAWTAGGWECSVGWVGFSWGGWRGSGLSLLASSRNKLVSYNAGHSLPSTRPPGQYNIKT